MISNIEKEIIDYILNNDENFKFLPKKFKTKNVCVAASHFGMWVMPYIPDDMKDVIMYKNANIADKGKYYWLIPKKFMSFII